MAAKLIGHVTVRDDDRVPHTFGPDDDVPGWARKKITNAGAWARDEDGQAPAESPKPDVKPEVVSGASTEAAAKTAKRSSSSSPKG